METYPNIQGSTKAPRKPCVAFCKYDGSNIRFEWSKKRGWYKFGTRSQMIDHASEIYGVAVPIFLEKYGDAIARVFVDSKDFRGRDKAVVFCEFFGAKSFAGIHFDNDPKDLVLFDVSVYKKGILGPKNFLRHFGHLDVAEVVYKGNLNEEFIRAVREGGIGFKSARPIKTRIWEGVVCKGGDSHELWMAKVKTYQYRDELQKLYSGNWLSFWE